MLLMHINKYIILYIYNIDINHHHSIAINVEQFCIWHSYFIDYMQNIFTFMNLHDLLFFASTPS